MTIKGQIKVNKETHVMAKIEGQMNLHKRGYFYLQVTILTSTNCIVGKNSPKSTVTSSRRNTGQH